MAYESNADTNAFTDADHTKLDGIEASAPADQSAAEIKTAYESNADTNAFTDAEQTKLAGIEASADVTDTANVTAAGAGGRGRPGGPQGAGRAFGSRAPGREHRQRLGRDRTG